MDLDGILDELRPEIFESDQSHGSIISGVDPRLIKVHLLFSRIYLRKHDYVLAEAHMVEAIGLYHFHLIDLYCKGEVFAIPHKDPLDVTVSHDPEVQRNLEVYSRRISSVSKEVFILSVLPRIRGEVYSRAEVPDHYQEDPRPVIGNTARVYWSKK
tara:strand:+ start:3398 stop:3865 length:468 start_codon:yes stop_codon:yes gene_type:complete